MSEDRELFPTRSDIAWPCADCGEDIEPRSRAFRVLDEQRGFPLICASCSGRLPAGVEFICAGCFEPIHVSALLTTRDSGTIWVHADEKEAKTVRRPCTCEHGLNSAGKCIRCRGEGFVERSDHLARPVES